MTKGYALTLVAILCLTGQTPADEVISTEPTPAQEKAEQALPDGTNSVQNSVQSKEEQALPDRPPSPAMAQPIQPERQAMGAGERWWVSTDYLLSWVRGSLLQPLVTTSPAGTLRPAAGVLGQNGTSILFGNGNFNNDMRSGIKVGAGGWFDAERTFGMDVGFFMLESQNTLFFASSQGDTILARPFFNALTFKQDSQVVAFPNVASGSIGASLRSNNLYSGHADLQEVFLEGPGYRLLSIVGYRYLRFDERLAVFQNVTSLGSGVVAAGTVAQTLDNFTAHNEVNAADLGLRAELLGQRWSLDLLFKMAVGTLERQITITGLTQSTAPGANTVTNNAGMLALASNSGQHSSNDWIVIPELGANLGWDITRNLRLRLGYDVLFWSNVARASDQVNLLINPNLFPPQKATGLAPFTPFFSLVKSDMWVQSVNLGLEFRY